MKRVCVLLFVVMMVFGLSVTVNATLYDRGGGLIYDDDFNITWLQDANYAMTSGYDADGLMNWDQAMTWADNLVFGVYDDWRLPTALNHDGTRPCAEYSCIGSEMGHLYYTELGNSAYGPLNNTGFFTNLQQGHYWSGTEWSSNPYAYAWDFNFDNGHQFVNMLSKGSNNYALAVRLGDVAAVPEPGTLLLLGSGLGGLIVYRKRRHG